MKEYVNKVRKIKEYIKSPTKQALSNICNIFTKKFKYVCNCSTKKISKTFGKPYKHHQWI